MKVRRKCIREAKPKRRGQNAPQKSSMGLPFPKRVMPAFCLAKNPLEESIPIPDPQSGDRFGVL